MSVLVKAMGEIYRLLARYGMEAVFMTMLVAARSKRHLRELHDAQPKNCRLMREGYLKLEQAWAQLYPNGYEAGADEQTLACILDALRKVEGKNVGNGDFTAYYREQLDQGQERIMVVIPSGIGSMIFSCPQRKGHGGEHFITTMFGQKFTMRFQLAEDGKRIGVRFCMWKYDLNEPLVYALLTKLPKFQISWRNHLGSVHGYEVDFCYILEREGLQEHILLHDGEGPGVTVGGKCHIAQYGFIPEVLRRLTAIGVPIETIDPIMVAERR